MKRLLLTLFLLCAAVASLALPLALSGCSSPPKLPDSGTAARQAAKGAFTASVLVIRSLDGLAAGWIDSVEHPTDSQLEVARQMVASLVTARDALAKAKPCIESGGQCAEDLSRAADLVRLVAGALDAQGVKIPPEVTGVLEFVSEYSRGES